jgi:hypothetical protein
VKSAIFFAATRASQPSIRQITSAEAVVRLVQQSASEQLDRAGPSEGAVAIVNNIACFELTPSDLNSTVKAILIHMGVDWPFSGSAA